MYSATHPKYGDVMLKWGTYSSGTSLERIRREVTLLLSLNSPYFPKNYEFCIDEKNNIFMIIEERIKGETLDMVSDRFRKENQIISLLKEILVAMSRIWDLQIVHRDLKPQNIMINKNNEPRIIDFGIARFLAYPSLTKTIAMFGPCTPIYASPEQLLNDKYSIDMRSDFFALGIIILELIYSFHPFDPRKVGNRSSIPENIVNSCYLHPKSNHKISSNFAELVERLLQRQPYRRFPNHVIFKEYVRKEWI